MICPKCKLENPPETEVCDCNYNFITKSNGKEPEKLSRKVLLTIVGLIVFLLGMFFTKALIHLIIKQFS